MLKYKLIAANCAAIYKWKLGVKEGRDSFSIFNYKNGGYI
jgi:hypothetical protein